MYLVPVSTFCWIYPLEITPMFGLGYAEMPPAKKSQNFLSLPNCISVGKTIHALHTDSEVLE